MPYRRIEQVRRNRAARREADHGLHQTEYPTKEAGDREEPAAEGGESESQKDDVWHPGRESAEYALDDCSHTDYGRRDYHKSG